MDNGTDVWLKITGTLAQALAILRGPDLSLLLRKDPQGNDELGNAFNHDIALLYHETLVVEFATHDQDGNEITPAVFDGPFLMIRLMSNDARARIRRALYMPQLDQDGNLVRKNLPPGITVVDNPPTIEWF